MSAADAGAGDVASHRVEADALGEIDVPEVALWGAQTQRGCENFRVSGVTLQSLPELVAALGQVKAAAVRANMALGEIPEQLGEAILRAAREVAANRLDEHFPLDVVQGGGGTATNMNANEVIANRAAELLGGRRGAYDLAHPNNHVNRSQSTNDVYPTALQLAVVARASDTMAGLGRLAEALAASGDRAGEMERLGRTCLQDALPVPVRAVAHGQASALGRVSADLGAAGERLLAVPLGATAVGTGLGSAPGYRSLVVGYLADETGRAVSAVADPFDALAHIDQYVAVASGLVRSMLVMSKIAADLRFLSSGPLGGVGEVRLPAVQVGSSIMPGKVNPVIPELVMQVGFEVRGAAAVVEAAAGAGELELNVMEPVVARHLLASLADVAAVARIFARRCIDGLEWQADAVARHLQGSLSERVELARRDGYAAASRAAAAHGRP